MPGVPQVIFWLGLIIGIVVGGCATLLIGIVPLVDRLDVLEAQGVLRYQTKLEMAEAELKKCERENVCLKMDIKQFERIVPPEFYERFFDTPHHLK
jgi:hypothetical protein